MAMDMTEALRCADYIVAAYTAWDSVKAHPFLTASWTPKIQAIADGNEVIAYITMKDFWLPADPGQSADAQDGDTVFYGYIAHNAAAGKYYFVCRGTEGLEEWWDDAHLFLMPFKEDAPGKGQVCTGFLQIYGSLSIIANPAAPGAHVAALESTFTALATSTAPFAAQVASVIRAHEVGHRAAFVLEELKPGEVDLSKLQVTATGHSLGAALSTLYLADNQALLDHPEAVALYTFASPQVGNADFAATFGGENAPAWRINNVPDIVTLIPFNMGGYVHVGTDVRFDSRSYDDVAWTISCFHDMNTYIRCVNPVGPLKPPGPGGTGSKCYVDPTSPLLKMLREAARAALGIPRLGPPP